MKTCNTCGEAKSFDMFPTNKSGTPAARCKTCYNTAYRERYNKANNNYFNVTPDEASKYPERIELLKQQFALGQTE